MANLPDPAAPQAMQAEVTLLCAHARHGRQALYGRLLRENVLGAVACSFPEFTRRAGPEMLAGLVDDFVASHPASLPQFHQIAEEFVVFAQGAPGFPAALTPVLEYEWVLLDVEIDPAHVASSAGFAGDMGEVTLNPTLRLLMLPFDATSEGWPMQPPASPPRPHAVWRNAAHGIVTRALGHDDCLLIEQLRQSGPLLPADLAKHGLIKPPQDVIAWAHAALAGDLLCLAHRKEAQP